MTFVNKIQRPYQEWGTAICNFVKQLLKKPFRLIAAAGKQIWMKTHDYSQLWEASDLAASLIGYAEKGFARDVNAVPCLSLSL